MRFKLSSVFSILLIVGSIEARPSKLLIPEISEGNDENSFKKVTVDDSSTWRSIEPRSSSSVTKTDSRTEHEGLRHMGQSLRTVATQLLNVTNPNDSKESIMDQKKTNNGKISPNVLLITNNEKTKFTPPKFSSNVRSDVKLINDVNSESIPLASSGGNFGRPVNSKFGYFESSHPGVAMALTEEELEREMMAAGSSTRLMTAHKNHPTTTGGISTWILLNPPRTTSKPMIDQETNDDKVVNVKVQSANKLTTSVENYDKTINSEFITASTLEKVLSPQTTVPMERITTITKSTTPTLKKTAAHQMTTTEKTVKPTQTTLKTEKTKVTPPPKTSIVTDPSARTSEPVNFTTTPRTVLTTKFVPDTNRSTLRPKITTPKPNNVTSKPMATKTTRPIGLSTKSKTPPLRKITTKSPVETTKNPNTSKIEKVTFRPIQMITTPKSLHNQSSVERPIFVTKVKTSYTADSNAIPVHAPLSNGTSLKNNETKSTKLDIEISPISLKTKKPIKNNHVLKVQLKKPTASPTDIEIEPIRVNAPVLRIEKIETKETSAVKKNSTKIDVPLIPDDARIDVKFDFSPVVTNFVAETTTQADTIATTTQRLHKRKKNKLRRRKPTTPSTSSLMTVETTSASIVTSSSGISPSSAGLETVTELGIIDNAIQESKIAPESKVTIDSGTKNKKKQVQKPIGTQIYNFLSREVMPSFGVMSLVGLGLGLASYFLYPFSGAIARRNYVVEPNYKYNMDEYGGNFGQREEEVFSKVLQGMTNQDGKYGGIKDYENNFYRYQQSYDHSYPNAKHTTRRAPEPSRYSTDANHRPLETTITSNEKYRYGEFKYPELPTTPNYYTRPKKPDFVAKKSTDRQFVVGNIPKEYNSDNRDNAADGSLVTTENLSSNDYQRYNYKFPADSSDVSPSYGHAEALKSNDDYEELEITPSAVQVEHGPRALNVVSTKLSRRKRESVIQVIPSRSEMEKEEPLSNEILDIIDSVIPGQKIDKDVMNTLEYNVNEKEYESMRKPFRDTLNNEEISQISGKTEKTTPASKTIDENVGNEETTSFTLEKNTVEVGSVEKTSESSNEMETMTTMSLDSNPTTTTTTTTVKTLTIEEILGTTSKSDENSSESSSDEWTDDTTAKPQEERFNLFTFVKKIAEVKLKLGVAVLKHASEGFARYLGHLQKRINGEE